MTALLVRCAEKIRRTPRLVSIALHVTAALHATAWIKVGQLRCCPRDPRAPSIREWRARLGDSELDERLRRAELALYGGGGRTRGPDPGRPMRPRGEVHAGSC